MFRRKVKYIFSLTLLLAIFSASVPLHNIFHNHFFLPEDDCHIKFCKNHIKSHEEHCHTFSDAVFTANLTQILAIVKSEIKLSDLVIYADCKTYPKHLFFIKNKAPPLLIAA